jgi:hypothetical protein
MSRTSTARSFVYIEIVSLSHSLDPAVAVLLFDFCFLETEALSGGKMRESERRG